MKIQQVLLGDKIHKPSFPNLAVMFPQIAITLRNQLLKHRHKWNFTHQESDIKSKYKSIHLFSHKNAAEAMRSNAIKRLQESQSKIFEKYILNATRNEVLTMLEWVDCLRLFIEANTIDDNELRMFTDLYLIRIVTFWQEIEEIDANSVENILHNQTYALKQMLVSSF